MCCVGEFRTFDTYNCHYLCNESTLNLSQLEHLLLAPSFPKFWSGCNYLQMCAESARQHAPTTHNRHQWGARMGVCVCAHLIFVSIQMLIRRRSSPTKLAQSLADNDNDNVPTLPCFTHHPCNQWRSNIYKWDKSTSTIIIAALPCSANKQHI